MKLPDMMKEEDVVMTKDVIYDNSEIILKKREPGASYEGNFSSVLRKLL